MGADTRKKIYDILKKKTGFRDSYEDFSSDLSTSEDARKKVFEVLRDRTGFTDSYDNFIKGISDSEPVEEVNPVTTVQAPSYTQKPETRERILNNIPDYFKSRGNDLSTLPLPHNTMSAEKPADVVGRISQDEQQRIQLAERAANDPYMRQQELEHVFKPKNQEQIDNVRQLINTARQQRVKERQQRVKSAGGGGLFSTMSQAYLAGEQNDTDKELEYASTLLDQAQNITNEAKKKGKTNFFAGFARGFKNAPLDGWAMGLQDLKNYSVAKKVMDKVDKGEELSPSEDALMQALVTNAATQMYYSGDLGRGYKAGGVTAESLPFMLDMIAGMGTIQAVTKPASKALVKYATEKSAKYGLGKAATGLAKGAARTVAGIGDVASHTVTFGNARLAADYQRRGLGDVQVKPNEDGTTSYDGRENVQTGAEAIAKSAISTAAETGTELLGEYFSPILGWLGRATGANRLGKIIPASVGKAYSSLVNSNGFKQIQEIARRAKIADPIGEYGEEVVNNLISTAIGDMTPEQLVDLDQNIDTFLGVAPVSVLFGAAGTGGYLREKYKNYRNIREFENEMRDAMGEDWSGVKESLQNADIETARGLVKDILSSDMDSEMKRRAINYISAVLQEQTLQEIDKQQMPEYIASSKKDIISNMQNAKETLSNEYGMSDEEIDDALRDALTDSNENVEKKYGMFKAYDIYDYRNAYNDYVNYTYWVKNHAYDARKQAEAQVQNLTNATTGTVMRVNAGFSKNPVNILRGKIVFDADGNVDRNNSDDTIYYLAEDGKVKMAPITSFDSLVDDSPADDVAQQAGNDAEEEVLQSEEAQINQPGPEVQPIEVGTTFQNDGVNYEVTQKTADGYIVSAMDADGNPMQSQLLTEEQLRNAISPVQEEQAPEVQEEQPVQETAAQPEQQTQEQQTAISRIPVNENGEQDFESAPYQDTSAALIEISDNVDDAKDTATQMINHYQEGLKKAEKAKTTGNTIQEIVKLKQDKKANIQAINNKIAYWNSVANEIESKRPGGIIEQAQEESNANQQRLASMTPEQQQAAQEEVQRKIDSGAYERKEPRKRARYVNEDNEMGTSNTPMEHVLREIATGRVTFTWNDSGETQGLGSHLGLASSPEERRRMIWALSSDGMTPEAAAEQIHADMPENLQGMVTDQDVFNMILESFQQYGTPSKMWEAAKSMHGTDVEESAPGYDDYMERQAIEWEASQNNMSVEEWQSYCDYIEEKLDNMYSSVSDEDLNAIFEKFNEQIIKENESRGNETEGAGSTEGQTDGKQSNELLPEGRGDNEGTDAAGDEQPEPANQTDGEGGSVVPESEGVNKNNSNDKTLDSGYTVEKRYHKKDNKDIYAVNFTERMDRADFLEAKKKAKEEGGYYSSFGKGGFIFETEEDAIKFAKGILSPNISETQKSIESARAEVEQNPTEAQKEAGNYKKGHVKVDGFDITIENPKGSVRSGKDADGKEWSVTMNNDYGYIRGTEGVDGDHIDVFLSDNHEQGNVYVIDQINQKTGEYDESKVMYGFNSLEEAKEAYLSNFEEGWKVGVVSGVTKEEFKKWIESSVRKTKPFYEYKSVNVEEAQNEGSKNRIVSNERYEELKNRLREKLGQLNAGIDPELIAIGAEMAVYHIERGAVKFAEYASAMIKDMGDAIRPYLKSFYSSARYMPEAVENGLSSKMTPDSEVSTFDVTNFDKKSIDIVEQINNVAKEQELKENNQSQNEVKPESELSGDSYQYQKKAAQESEAVREIGVSIREKALIDVDGLDATPLTMKDVKNILNNYDMLSEMSATDMQELVELAMTNETRKVALRYINGEKQKFGYDLILSMYNMQPLLNARDSTRFERQQYSTPTPFGYVMGQFVNSGKKVGSVLEPSAGNGALTITFPSVIVHVNDIDERRVENLRTLGYGKVTTQDALIPFDEKVDAVVTNPPFGTTTAKEFDGGKLKISSLEGLMAINALDSMKDDGRAAIVIGGNTSYRDNGAMQSKDMKLFAYLYSHYNVVDVINLDGDMYKRNGTKYDVRIILINGRKTGPFKLTAPPVRKKARAEQVKTFDELYNRVQDDIRSIQQMGNLFDSAEGETRSTDGQGSGTDNNVSNQPESGKRRESVQRRDGIRPDNDMGSTGTAAVSERGNDGKSGTEGNAGTVDNENGPDAGSVATVQEQRGNDGGEDAGGIRSGNTVSADSGNNTGRSRLSVNLSDEKVPYPNRSQSGTLMSVVPANQAQVLADSLANIGDVDQFLVDELGYSSKDELFSYLAAEQIDSVSLAINQMNKGNGFIIGDMTGVGKGRQGAALVRYAVRKGYKPIYFTQKPALFSDNYRDLSDIGSSNLRPFIIASDPKNAAITDASGNLVYKIPSDKEKKRVFDYILQNGTLPDEYDYVITTYSQINNGTKEYEATDNGITEKDKSYKKKSPSAADKSGQERRNVIAALAKNNIMILDESHTAGGSGGGSMFMQYIMPNVKGVTFLSATFAKRADNMPIYAMKTDLSKSGVSPQEMIEAISQGGVTLQEIMSKQLVQSGQMIRRERSFQGVTIDWMPVNEEEDAVQRKQFDEVSSIFSDIRAFQKDYITPIVSDISDELADEGGYSDLQRGTKELGVTNTPFASKMYNLVNQLLFSLKADAVANRVIYNLKNGFKPVISFTNTMEGFLDEAPKDTPMDKVPNFSLTLMKALDGVMRYSVDTLGGEKENKSFLVSELSEEGQQKYYEIKKKIENLSANLPISPMDAIKMKIEAEGYKVGEITGRNLEMVKDENGKYVIRNRKDKDKKTAARDFNNGKLDVLMINKSGSTGISLHASPKFEDQRQRVMVFAQFQSDINDEVQMRGRIDRTGQIYRGKYEYIMSSIPAEQRLQMMFKAKLKSLDANTTSSQKSKFNEMEVVDYLNKYGDEVTWQYMLEHPELSEKLGDPLNMLNQDGETTGEDDADTSKKEGCAAKIARYLPFLPVSEQEEVFKEITDAYSVKIQLLNDAGENDLEITTMPLRAKTISKKIWKQGTEPDSGNAFADNTYLEEVEVDVLKKPMKASEIESTIKRMSEGEDFQIWRNRKIAEIESTYNNKIEVLKNRISESANERAEKAKKTYIEKSKEARSKGKNEFTDEEIDKMSEVVVEDILKKADESFTKQKNVIEARRDNILKQVNSFTPLKPLVIPFNLDESMATLIPSRGMFLGFKFSKDFSPSSSTAVFATMDGRRKVEIPLNQDKAFHSIRMNTMMQPTFIKDVSLETWDSYVPTQSRKKAYIVTGNLLQALVDTMKTNNVRGYLVSYSTIDGETKQGILMSDSFKPENLTTSAPISSRLVQIQQGESVTSEDKRVTVEKNTGWRTGYALKVPRSKKLGGEFFEDNKLRSLAENKEFTTRGNYMVADIPSENLSEVLDRLSKMGVTVSKKAKLENVSDVRFREGERSIVDPLIQELMMRFQGEDISRYPYVDVRRDPDSEYEVYWGYSEPLYKGKNAMDSPEVPELVKDHIRKDEYEIDKRSIIDWLEGYIDFNVGYEEAEEGQKVLDWFKENMKDFKMSDKVNLIVEKGDFPDTIYRENGENSSFGGVESDVKDISKKMNIPVQVITSKDQITDPSVKSAIESGRKIKGWFSVSEGKVYLYLPNASGIEDIKQTILHEGVAHYGLRKLVGDERMDDFLDDVFNNVSSEVRKRIVDTLPRYGYDSRVATEEYIARIAENGVDVSVWERIKQAFKNLLRKMGINININDNELRYILWRSRNNLENGNVIDYAKDVAMQYQMGVGNYYKEDSDLSKEEENIIYKSKANGTYMKAPNGKDTNLNERQWVQVRTKSFKNWFGDWENNPENSSKVVDENGEPMVVYHGTKDYFEIFDKDKIGSNYYYSNGFFFTNDKSSADNYSFMSNDFKNRGYVFEVYLNIKNPLNENAIDYYGAVDKYDRNYIDIMDSVSLNSNDGVIITSNNGNLFVALNPNQIKSATENNGSFNPDDPNIRFREGESDGSREKYESSLQGWKYKAREAYQDSMLALKNLQDVIAKVSGKTIKSFEDAYTFENQLSSKNTSESEKYYDEFFVPLLNAEGKLIKKYGLTHKAIERYMMLSHGIERNVEMTFREQLNEIIKENPDDAQQFIQDFKDEKEKLRAKYSGYEYLKALSDYMGEVGDFSATEAILKNMDNEEHADFQNDALDYVKEFEDMYDVKELWEKTNNATKETLKKSYESGMMDKDHYNSVQNMFMYYVPLRGWTEETAEDVYEYINSERNPVNSVLSSMKGRKSVPDEVIATIGNMAESSILQGNRNIMKQAFMNMVVNHPTDVATLRKAWYVYDPVKDEWSISMPEIEENDTPETIAEKIKNHDEKMKQLEEQGLATRKSKGLNIDYRIMKNNISQHAVIVKNGGKDYVIYVNGNPRAAQAVNGLTNPDAEKNPIFNAISRANRWLAANFTTRNPAFVMSNLSRDLIFSTTAVWIKEDAKYSSRFRKNILTALPTVVKGVMGKGKNSEADKYFREFVENGGETGYMYLHDVDAYKKKVKKELARITGERGSAKRAMDYTLERLEDFNRMAEDISRFAVYMTSRQMGRSIVESVRDAKEITVNFNKKGAGYKTGGFFGLTAGAMRNLYLFFNASVQSLTNFNRLRVKNPVNFYSALGGFMTAGMIIPVVNNLLYSMIGGGDDNPYNDLPEWVRRNNLCIYSGNGQFVTIPLPIEMRAFYGLGDYAYQLMAGRDKLSPTGLAKGTVSQLADLLPLNPTGNEGFKTFVPDALAPLFETYVWNEDFTGKPIAKLTPFNERDPEWKRVYKGTSGWLVDASKFFNDLTNGGGPGSDFRKGVIDFNPAKVENLLESYFGGMAKFLNQSGKTIYYGAKSIAEGEMDDNLTARNVPVINRFYNRVDDINAFAGVNTDYFKLRDEMEQFKYELNGVKKNYRNNPDEYRQMVNSDMFRKYMKFKSYQDLLDRLYKIGKETEGEERKQIEDKIIETRREVLQAVK